MRVSSSAKRSGGDDILELLIATNDSNDYSTIGTRVQRASALRFRYGGIRVRCGTLFGVSCNAHNFECASIRNKLGPTPSILRFTVEYCRFQLLPPIYPFHFALTSPPVFYVPGWSFTSVLLRVLNEERIYPFHFALTSPPVFYVPGWSFTSVLLRVLNEERRK